MKLSVIIPAYNEANTITQVLKSLAKVPLVHEVVVIDDGSTDDTVKQVKHFKGLVVLVQHESNQGKGKAIQSGLAKVSGDYVLIQDADLEYDPTDIPALVKPIQQNKAEVVYGSRFTGPRRNMFFWHMLGNRFLSLLVNVLYNTTLSDMETGYKLLPTNIMRSLQLQENDFGIEPEITCKLLNRGHFIYETPISYTGRTFAEGKKITWKDGFKAVFVIIKYRFIQ